MADNNPDYPVNPVGKCLNQRRLAKISGLKNGRKILVQSDKLGDDGFHVVVLLLDVGQELDLGPGPVEVVVSGPGFEIGVTVEIVGQKPQGQFVGHQFGGESKVFLFRRAEGVAGLFEVAPGV